MSLKWVLNDTDYEMDFWLQNIQSNYETRTVVSREAGCRHWADPWADPKIGVCETVDGYEKLDQITKDMAWYDPTTLTKTRSKIYRCDSDGAAMVAK